MYVIFSTAWPEGRMVDAAFARDVVASLWDACGEIAEVTDLSGYPLTVSVIRGTATILEFV